MLNLFISISPERKSIVISVMVNIALAGVQLIAGFLSGSYALIADATHSISDLISDVIVFIVIYFANQAPDENHHYGHQRYKNLASALLGAILMGTGVGIVVMAILQLENTNNINTVSILALWVALGSLITKELLFRYMLRIAKQVDSGLLEANAWHARSDAASSFIALIGITGNLLGISSLDRIAMLIVGFFIIKTGTRFLWDSLNDLVDRATSQEIVLAIQKKLLNTPGVLGVHELKTRKSGDLILVDVHLEVNAYITILEGHSIALAARKNILDNFPVLNIMIHIDPFFP